MALAPAVRQLTLLGWALIVVALVGLAVAVAAGLAARNELPSFVLTAIAMAVFWSAGAGRALRRAAAAPPPPPADARHASPRRVAIFALGVGAAAGLTIGLVVVAIVLVLSEVAGDDPLGAGAGFGPLAGLGFASLVNAGALARRERSGALRLLADADRPRRVPILYAVPRPGRAPEGDTAHGPSREGQPA